MEHTVDGFTAGFTKHEFQILCSCGHEFIASADSAIEMISAAWRLFQRHATDPLRDMRSEHAQ